MDINYLKQYAEEAAADLVGKYFSNKPFIDGRAIVTFSEFEQVNFFILKALFEQWKEESKEAWAFYDGDQWSQEEKEKLAEKGQAAIVINKIASKVDNISGSEISGRTRISYRSRSGEPYEEKTAL